ncbi:MAG: hypothetical protein KGH76_06215 [Thaumarchaeota archaeon]|nr:hypothetical protein [Nitrososphaerota archaeon]
MNSDRKMYKELVTVVIEKALLDISLPVYESIISSLKNKYDCSLSDCYEHPQYLKRVLTDYFGSACNVVIDKINSELQSTIQSEPITEFLTILNR